jgi:hypothetical protein
VVTVDVLTERARLIAGAPQLRELLAHLRRRAQPLQERLPLIPEQKALLSVNGGRCPDDGTPLTFDPWSPAEHRCSRCGKSWRGERHDRHWARFQHLWLASSAAQLATLVAVGTSEDRWCAARAREILAAYAERYWRYPNRDNLLGPSRLFFSTYLESLWLCSYLAAATLLRAAAELDDATARGVHQVAEEAAALIGEYDEMFSNRQTWNDAALTAVAVWFEDEALAQRAIEGETGLIEHLVRGYGRDGLWFEGENYHLFALRGMLTGISWAQIAGVDFCADDRLAARLHAALRAPGITALPDGTYPARKDARYGVSLAQPAHLELWEVGLARLTAAGRECGDLVAWLDRLYALPAPPISLMDAYLVEPGVAPSSSAAGFRTSLLSWWSLLEMLPELPAAVEPWRPGSVLLESQGLAILRRADRYASLECGTYGGGHGHPDRLHLTLYANGVHWLPDPGTGEYVTRDLFWYRSTLAHNAPLLDRASQTPGNATCECFEDAGEWAWVRGRFGDLSRMVATGPDYIVDVLDLSGRDEHVLGLPWHIAGRGGVETKGRWEPGDLVAESVTTVERFIPDAPGPIVLRHGAPGADLTLFLVFDGELLEAEGPGLPGSGERARFYLARARGRNVRIVAVIEPHRDGAVVRTVRTRGDVVEVETRAGIDRHRFSLTEWTVEQHDQPALTLRGVQHLEPPFTPLLELDPPLAVAAPAFRVGSTPPLDGTLEGFEVAEPLELSLEDQYRRSEDAYPGPEDFSARAYAAWDESSLYLAIDVTKPDVCLRPSTAPPLLLDNEPDDIHSDGLQVYVAPMSAVDHDQAAAPAGYLIVPQSEGRAVRASATSDANGAVPERVHGGWRRTESGYCVTVAIPWPSDVRPHAGGRVRFDVIVNEMLPGRERRVGQLVWSGGGGWVWLRGDRQDPSRLGVLELVG